MRRRQRNAGKHDSRLLAARELQNGLQVAVPFQPEPPQKRPHPLGLDPCLGVHSQKVLHWVLVHRQNINKVLGVAAHTQLVAPPLLTGSRLKVPRQQVQQRGLACAVGAHNGRPRAHVHPQINIFQSEVLSPRVLKRNIDERQEGRREF